MNLEGMSLATLMPFIIKVAKYYLPSTLLLLAVVLIVLALVRLFGLLNRGNLPKYNPERMDKIEDSPLKDKHILFLGSSVTKGFAAYGKSFVDMIAERNGAFCLKAAVSGTTLVDNGEKSYVRRLQRIPKNTACDIFVCQLSTNDATKGAPLGQISQGREMSQFDTKTVCGAMEYIIAYVKETWNCPVVFYTSPQYASVAYLRMVNVLKEIAEKWDIQVIDLWNHPTVNAKKNKKRSCMNDQIHPTKRGYQVWTPIIEQGLVAVLSGESLPFHGSSISAEEVQKVKRSRTIKKILKWCLYVVLVALLAAVICAVRFFSGITYPTDGNDPKYLPENITPLPSSPLQGKTILSVGSSVSYGNGSGGVSFEDYLEVLDGAHVISVSEGATTIAKREGLTSSYPERLLRAVEPDWDIDAVILQVSTNDASAGSGIGQPTDSFDPETFDLTTTCGGLEYLISYCTSTWDCPVIIYSSAPFESGPLYDAQAYGELVETVHTVVDKWSTKVDITFIDQWNNESMQNISHEELVHYMTDPVHPAMAGYLEWWMPNFQAALYPYFED